MVVCFWWFAFVHCFFISFLLQAGFVWLCLDYDRLLRPTFRSHVLLFYFISLAHKKRKEEEDIFTHTHVHTKFLSQQPFFFIVHAILPFFCMQIYPLFSYFNIWIVGFWAQGDERSCRTTCSLQSRSPINPHSEQNIAGGGRVGPDLGLGGLGRESVKKRKARWGKKS